MNIKLDNKYYLTSDGRQYILQQKKIAQEGQNKGKEYYEPIGYFTKIASAVKAYKELKIKTSNTKTIDELIQLIKDLDKKIETIFQEN